MQQRAYAARVSAALDSLPLARDEEGLRVERLLEDGGAGLPRRDDRVAVREATDRDAHGRVVGPARAATERSAPPAPAAFTLMSYCKTCHAGAPSAGSCARVAGRKSVLIKSDRSMTRRFFMSGFRCRTPTQTFVNASDCFRAIRT